MSFRRQAFSLVELLIVIAVIGLLVAMLLPALSGARESARRMSCSNNLRQIGIAVHSYHETHKRLPPGWIVDDPNAPSCGATGWGWAAKLLPHMDQVPLALSIADFKLDIADPKNQVARTDFIASYRCPSNPNRSVFTQPPSGRCGGKPSADLASSDYVGVTARSSRMVPTGGCTSLNWSSEDTVFAFNQSAGLRDIADGISHTFIIGERSCKPFPSAWAGAVPTGEHARARVLGLIDSPPQSAATVDREYVEFGSYHPAGSQFLTADGAVRMVYLEIEPALFRDLCTRGGGELVTAFFADD